MTKRSSVSAIGVSSISLLAGVMASLGLALATTALAQTPQPPTPLAPTPLPSAAPPSVTVSEPVSPPPAFVPTAPSARIDLDEVDRRARALMARRGMVGLAVAVIDDGEIVMTRGYGKTAQRLGTPVSETTLFRWASVSKSVAAAAAMSVAEEGHFGLSSPVDAFISTELPESRRALTLEHLLSHRTGLPRNSYDPVVEDGRSETHVKSRLAGTDTVCEPGRCHAYQNVAFDLSTDMVEAALGVPYASAVRARLFAPLGMDTAVLSHEGFVTSADWARPHNSRGVGYRAVKRTYFRIPGAAGVSSSIADLAKWVQANMTGANGTLSESAREQMREPRTRTLRRQRQLRRKYPFLRNASYGLGWRLYDYEGPRGDLHRVVAHRGAVQGYRASVIFDPATGDGVALMWNNSSSRPHGLAYEVMDQSYGKRKRDWLGLNQAVAKVAGRYKTNPPGSGDTHD